MPVERPDGNTRRADDWDGVERRHGSRRVQVTDVTEAERRHLKERRRTELEVLTDDALELLEVGHTDMGRLIRVMRSVRQRLAEMRLGQ